MPNDNTPQPWISQDGVPWCRELCHAYRHRIDPLCAITLRSTDNMAICLPAVRAMAQRLRELEDRA